MELGDYMLEVGDLVTDEFGGLAIILDIGNKWNDAVIIQFIESGIKHSTFKSCVYPLEELCKSET